MARLQGSSSGWFKREALKAHEGYLTRYSNDTVTWIQRLTVADVEGAIKDYKALEKPKSV